MESPPDPAQVELLQLWAESIEAKDHYTASHCERVAEYTERLGLAMGIEGTQLQWLRDIGFEDVDCGWKWLELALLVGVRPMFA